MREVQQLRTKRVTDLRGRLDRLEEAFIYERPIDHSVYERQRDRLQEDLALADNEQAQRAKVASLAGQPTLYLEGSLAA